MAPGLVTHAPPLCGSWSSTLIHQLFRGWQLYFLFDCACCFLQLQNCWAPFRESTAAVRHDFTPQCCSRYRDRRSTLFSPTRTKHPGGQQARQNVALRRLEGIEMLLTTPTRRYVGASARTSKTQGRQCIALWTKTRQAKITRLPYSTMRTTLRIRPRCGHALEPLIFYHDLPAVHWAQRSHPLH